MHVGLGDRQEDNLLPLNAIISTLLIAAGALTMITLERLFPYVKGQPFFRKEFWTDLLWFSIIFSAGIGLLVNEYVISGFDSMTGWSQTRGIKRLADLVTGYDLFIYP